MTDNIDWNRLDEHPQIRSMIEEVRKELIEEKLQKCEEANKKLKQDQNQKIIENSQSEDDGDDEDEENEKEKEQNEIKAVLEDIKKQEAEKQKEKEIPIWKKCLNCKRSDIPVSSCAGCKEVYYCTVDCQKLDWKNHRKQCLQKQEEIKEDKRLEEKRRQKNIDWFRKIDNAGQGNFSIILKMEEISTQKIYAIKVIEKKRLKQLGKEKDILMEKHALKKLENSPYVINFIDTFQDELSLYIQMEYVDGGELWNYCRIFGMIGQNLVKYFFVKSLLALEYIHSKGIIHRDIKPENILVVQSDKSIKYCDFGTSRDMHDNTIQGAGTGRPGKKRFDHFVGTPNFMPPECLRNKGSEFSSDIFSLGGLAFQLQSGFPPFLGKSEFLIFLQSEKEDPIFAAELWEDSLELKDLILKMMKKEMNDRITLPEIKKHSYFNGIDWNNLPTYQESLQEMSKSERFFQNVKADLFDSFDKLNEKENLVKERFKEWENRLQGIEEFTNEEKSKMKKRLAFMQKQAKQFFNVEEFFWQDFEYKAPPTPQVQKQDSDEEDQEK